jgi:hypothetical protein
LVFQAQMSPISPLLSSYQPWPGTGSVMASQSSCEEVDRGQESIESTLAAGAAGVHDGVEDIVGSGIVISAEILQEAEPSLMVTAVPGGDREIERLAVAAEGRQYRSAPEALLDGGIVD